MDPRSRTLLHEAQRLSAPLPAPTPPTPSHNPSPTPSRHWPITIRQATPSELSYITRIILASSSTEASFIWRFPYRTEYPQDMYDHIWHEYHKYVESRDWAVMVAEVPVLCTNELGRREEELVGLGEMSIIAVAVWYVSALPSTEKEKYVAQLSRDHETPVDETNQVPPFASFNRASNPHRIYAWKNILSQARTHYFPDPCGPYLHLHHVATHLQYQRHGVGAAVVRWGLDIAKERKFKIGVFASSSPSGGLCEYLGFEDVGWTRVRAEGESESRGVNVRVMIWGLEGQEK